MPPASGLEILVVNDAGEVTATSRFPSMNTPQITSLARIASRCEHGVSRPPTLNTSSALRAHQIASFRGNTKACFKQMGVFDFDTVLF